MGVYGCVRVPLARLLSLGPHGTCVSVRTSVGVWVCGCVGVCVCFSLFLSFSLFLLLSLSLSLSLSLFIFNATPDVCITWVTHSSR